MITAKKILGGKVITKQFSETTWAMMGRSKHGWEESKEPVQPMTATEITQFLSQEKKTPVVPAEPVVAEKEVEPVVAEKEVVKRGKYKKK